jgi:hypothetical protein
MPGESWVEEQEKNTLFRGVDVRQQAEKMLQISPTNRIVGVKLGRYAIAVRQLNVRLGDKWDWLGRLADVVEEYQLTIGESWNSRLAFIEALKTEVAIQEQGKKSKLLGIL